MLSAFLKKPSLRFILVGSISYLGLFLLYEFYLNPHTFLDEQIINNLVIITEKALKSLSYATIEYSNGALQNRVGVTGSTGLFIGEPCNGFSLFILFLAFIVAFPGPVKHKIWFIPVGILLIHLINALRVIGLVLIVNKNPQWLSFNHDYTFTILVYSFVFLLWWIWINKFSPLSQPAPHKNE